MSPGACNTECSSRNSSQSTRAGSIASDNSPNSTPTRRAGQKTRQVNSHGAVKKGQIIFTPIEEILGSESEDLGHFNFKSGRQVEINNGKCLNDFIRRVSSLNCDQYKKVYRKCQKLTKLIK